MKLAIPPFGHTLGAGLRELLEAGGTACRIELAPQSPFGGDPEFQDDNLSAWTIINSGAAAAINANTTRLDRLVIDSNSSTVWFAGSRSGPYVYQELTGDFDVYGLFTSGPVADTGAFLNGGFMLQSGSDEADWLECGYETRSGGCHRIVSTVDSVSTEYITYSSNLDDLTAGFMGELGLIRVRRVGNDFTIYVWNFEDNQWTQLKSIARADFPSTIRVGVVQYGNSADGYVTCDFVRTWPPYLATSPTSNIVIDSGSAGTVWDASTFNALMNPYAEYNPQAAIGFGSLAFQYGAGESNPPALNGSDLTEAQLQAQADPTGRYLRLQVKYVSAGGYQQASFLGATIDATVNSGGPADFPAEADVRLGVDYDNGDLTGTLALPAEADVALGVQYGAAGTEFTGTYVAVADYPIVGDVREGIEYSDGDLIGTLELPAQGDVRQGVQYGTAGTQFTGTLFVPSVTPPPEVEDFLQRGADWLGQQLKKSASRTVEYRRGAVSVMVNATLGQSLFRIATTAGTKVQRTQRDFIFVVADLEAGGVQMDPKRGDRVIDVGGLVYEVLPVGDEPPFRYCDAGDGVSQGSCVRVHTKRIGTE